MIMWMVKARKENLDNNFFVGAVLTNFSKDFNSKTLSIWGKYWFAMLHLFLFVRLKAVSSNK